MSYDIVVYDARQLRVRDVVVSVSVTDIVCVLVLSIFFFQAEDGIRDLVRSRGLGDVYKRQDQRDCGRRSNTLCWRYRAVDRNSFRRKYDGHLDLSLIHI